MHVCVDMFMRTCVYTPVLACMCRLVYIALQRPHGGDQVPTELWLENMEMKIKRRKTSTRPC